MVDDGGTISGKRSSSFTRVILQVPCPCDMLYSLALRFEKEGLLEEA